MKTLILLLVVFVVSAFADWTGAILEPENSKKINGKVFYVITSAEELAWFAEQVNGGRSTINAVLANDIRFKDDTTKTSSVNWTPIGKDSTAMFDGIFDGAGKTIYGLYSTQDRFTGMFGVTDSNAVIRNLSSQKTSIKSSKYAGGIVAWNSGTITGCTNGGTVHSGYYSYTGGIAGSNYGTITGCTNSGAVSSYATSSYAYSYTGGIAGSNYGTITGCTNSGTVSFSSSSSSYTASSYTGGIAGRNYGTITGCTNSGSVSTTSSSYTGGIAGSNGGTISDCTNSGSVSTTSSYTGGIAGSNGGTISDCTNSGSVSSYSSYTGGIAGSNGGTITGCTNGGAVSSSYYYYTGGIAGYNGGTITDCKNWGSVKADAGLVDSDSSSGKLRNSFSVADTAYYGVIRINSGTVTNCYYDSDILSGRSSGAPNLGLHTSEMQRDQFAWILNTTNGTAAHSGVWSRDSVGYPIFADSLHLPIYKVVFDDSGATTNRYTNYKGLVSFPGDPEPPEGKMFSGWYTDDGVKVKSSTVFTKDQTVHAVYIDASDIYFSIRFFNADTTLLDSQYVQYGKTPIYGGTPTLASTAKYSYTFEGWHVEPTAATEDFDYYAVYSETLRSYTVRFLDFDGTELQSSTYLYGATPGVLKTPTRQSTAAYDYAFSGWTPAIKSVTGDAVYTALYDSTKVLYTVTFMDGNSVFATVRVPYGETANAPGTPAREGYKFVGWNGALSNVTEDVTVSALFEELVYRDVVIDRGDDGMDTVKVEDDEWFALPEAPEKAGHTFTGWYGPDGDYLGKAGDTVKVSADMRIEPRYEANLYRIAFVNGSDTLQSGEVAYGKLPSYEGKIPTKTSSAKYAYTFTGWEPALKSVTGDAVYTALYDSTNVLYTVAFMDGDSVLAKVRVGYGETAKYPNATPVRPGYKFVGWNGSLSNVTGDVTVSALFEANLYRIAFVNGSDTLQSGEVAYGKLPSYEGKIPTKTSSAKYTYTFKGWEPALKSVTGDAVYTAVFDSTKIPQSSSSAASSSSGKSSSSEASSSSSAKSSSSSAVENSSSSSENPDVLVANLPAPTWSVTVSGRNFQVHAAPVGKPYALFDLQGKVLAKGRIESSEMTLSAPRAGSYIVRIGANTVRMNAK